MLDNITPGSRVLIKVVKRPTNAAATKTIVRLLSKDAAVHREVERYRAIRRKRNPPRIRSGRIWVRRLVKQRPVQGRIGESGTITASMDVLHDLGSVSRFVEVSAA